MGRVKGSSRGVSSPAALGGGQPAQIESTSSAESISKSKEPSEAKEIAQPAMTQQEKARQMRKKVMTKQIAVMNLKSQLNMGLIEKKFGAEVARDFKTIQDETTSDISRLQGKQASGQRLEINEQNKLDRLVLLNKELKSNPMPIAKAIQENRKDPAYDILGPSHFAAMEVATRTRLEARGKGDYGLNTMERVCIYGYTTQDYAKLNPELRDGKGATCSNPKIQAYADHIRSGLAKLPDYAPEQGKEAVLYRGMMSSKLPSHIKDEIRPGGTLQDYAFVSTSVQRDAASSAGDIQLNIRNFAGKGAKLLPFSAFEGEGEVLFPPGTQFHLTKLAPYSQVRYEVDVH